jgi:hypothetical protein
MQACAWEKIWVVVYIYRLGVGKNYGPLKIPKY